ncbi:hypothetical protein CANCADRAFT_16384, partial [Tortispora caseinolytica NRRL Y-17796]
FDKHQDSVFFIDANQAKNLLVTGGGDDIAYVWSAQPDENRDCPLVATLDGHTESVSSGGFSPDGSFLVTADMNGKVSLWSTTDWRLIHSEELEEIVWVAFHPSEPYIAIGTNDGSISVYYYDAEGLSLTGTLYEHTMATTFGVFVPGSDLTLISSSEDGTIICWAIAASTKIWKLSGTDIRAGEMTSIVTLALNPQTSIGAAGSRDGKIVIFSLQGRVLNIIETAKPNQNPDDISIESLSWCSSLPLLAAGSVSGSVFIFDSTMWRLRKTINAGTEAVTKVLFLGTTPMIAVSNMDGVLTVYDARTGQSTFQGTGHTAGIFDFAVLADGKIATASDDHVCLLF